MNNFRQTYTRWYTEWMKKCIFFFIKLCMNFKINGLPKSKKKKQKKNCVEKKTFLYFLHTHFCIAHKKEGIYLYEPKFVILFMNC